MQKFIQNNVKITITPRNLGLRGSSAAAVASPGGSAVPMVSEISQFVYGFQDSDIATWPRTCRLRDGEIVDVQLNKDERNPLFVEGDLLTFLQIAGTTRGDLKGNVCALCFARCTEANRAKKPLLPKNKEDHFNGIQWWSNPRHTNIYRGLMRVAIVNLIVHASAARPERTFSWAGIVAVAKRARLNPNSLKLLVYLKRNSKYMPSAQEMAAEYLRVYRKRK